MFSWKTSFQKIQVNQLFQQKKNVIIVPPDAINIMILINKQQALTPHVTSSYPQHVESSDSFDTVIKGFVSLDIKILKKE